MTTDTAHGEQAPWSNVFSALYRYRPRRDTTANENFLTEALAYTLQRSKAASREWVRLLSDGQIDPAQVTLATQARLEHAKKKSTAIPDLHISGMTRSRRSFTMLVEHKWNARVVVQQLDRYAKTMDQPGKKVLALIYANERDTDRAAKYRPPTGIRYKHLKWEAVYSALSEIRKPDPFLRDFLLFMDDRSLSPGAPLKEQDSIDCAFGRAAGKRGSQFRRRLMRYCEKLAHQFEWASLPSFFRYEYLNDSWGRCAFGYYGRGNGPEITFGFYHNEYDHRLPFLDKKRGIDLALRLLAAPAKNKEIDHVLNQLIALVPKLEKLGATVHLRGHPDNGNGNTLFIARRVLVDVIAGTKSEDEQIEAIHAQFKEWLDCLFADPRVMASLNTLKPY